MVLQILRHGGDCSSLRICLRLSPLRLTTFARPISGGLCQCRGREEAYLLSHRPPAGATRLAIDLRRLHRIDKLPIRANVPLQHLLPLLSRKITWNCGYSALCHIRARLVSVCHCHSNILTPVSSHSPRARHTPFRSPKLASCSSLLHH